MEPIDKRKKIHSSEKTQEEKEEVKKIEQIAKITAHLLHQTLKENQSLQNPSLENRTSKLKIKPRKN